jgi:hypothetical protein
VDVRHILQDVVYQTSVPMVDFLVKPAVVFFMLVALHQLMGLLVLPLQMVRGQDLVDWDATHSHLMDLLLVIVLVDMVETMQLVENWDGSELTVPVVIIAM